MLLTRSPLEHPQAGLSVRLACVKHAASVRPEPGSNSPSNAYNQTPKRSHSQQRENLNPKRAKLTHSKSNRTSHHGGDRTIRQYQTKLALTIGTLLSSQRTDTHPRCSLEHLRGKARTTLPTRPVDFKSPGPAVPLTGEACSATSEARTAGS